MFVIFMVIGYSTSGRLSSSLSLT